MGANKNREASGPTEPSARSGEPKNVLENIDKLLNAVSDLMQRESRIDKKAFEHMRQLRVRIRFAMSDLDRAAMAPPKWLDRADRDESPVDFLRREYLGLFGKISRPDIKRLDRSLYAALTNWVSKHGDLPPDINIPTKREAIEKKLNVAGDVRAPSRSRRVSEMTASDVEKLRLYDLVRQRKKRNND